MFSVRYVSPHGWMIHFNGKPWDVLYHNSEWDAIAALRETHPAEAAELERIHSSVG